MLRAGIDLIVYDAFPTLKLTLRDLPGDPTLPLLMDRLAHQDDQPRKLQMCFYVEKYLGNPSVEEYEFALDYIKSLASEKPYYFRYHGKPLVLAYLNGENLAINEVEWRNTYFCLRGVRPF